MASKLFFAFFLVFLPLKSTSSWVKAGYYYSGNEIYASEIKATLFTHLICGFAFINFTNYKLSINSSEEHKFSNFTRRVKRRNPSVMTLLSIWGGREDSSVFSSMINHSSYRKSFIDSSIRTARLYEFHGIDLYGVLPRPISELANLGTLLKEWRSAITSEARNSSEPELMLVMAGYYLKASDSLSYPFDSMQRNLDWVHFVAYDYYLPTKDNVTGFHAALYGPSGWDNTDSGIKEWRRRGFSSSKLVIGLPYHGFAWTRVNRGNNGVGTPASGPATTADGSMAYKFIKSFVLTMEDGEDVSNYNDTFVVNQYSNASLWANFDDVEAIRAKVSYAKKNGLLGYNVFQLGNDESWTLSEAAYQIDEKEDGWKLLVIILGITAIVILMLGVTIYYQRKRIFKSKGMVSAAKVNKEAAGTFHGDAPDLHVYKFSDIEAATDEFSYANKLGQGGYGPVYKGILPDGQEIAVKKLSKASTQGFEEFKNEVTLTARLQHVNLVRLLGFCVEREEQMLVYEYMPNKSLDFHLFDPIRRLTLDWNKRVGIIEGVTQGLLYLQEYSRFTIIHRDLKASNILLDHEMKPKISDFGMARMFTKDEQEANTSKIVGTYGYVPPEYVKQGLYSTKSDVYSFGVLLIQIISGKKTGGFYGEREDLKLLEYAYELWKEGKGMEFVDPSLDDTSSPCKLMRCMQIALLCVQEHATDRPSMLEVSSMLRNEYNSLAIPKKPAFSKVKDGEEVHESQRLEIISVNDATMSQIVGR